MDKIKINKLIIVEGIYDKIKLENIVDANIIAINGFSIFNNREMKATVKALAKDYGALILTDSDTAGYRIRVYINEILSGCDVENVFVPQISGKEKRKFKPSAEGYLGIEGTDDDILIKALCEYSVDKHLRKDITHTDLYMLGFMGTDGCKAKKNDLLNYLGVQKNISNNFLLKILNSKFTKDEFYALKFHND